MILPSHSFFFKETSSKKTRQVILVHPSVTKTFYFAKEIKQIELFLEPDICVIFLPEPLTTSGEASRAVTFLIQPC